MSPLLAALLLAGCATSAPSAPPPATLSCPAGAAALVTTLAFDDAFEGLSPPFDGARAVQGLHNAGFANLTSWTDSSVVAARTARWRDTTTSFGNGTRTIANDTRVETWTYRVTGTNGSSRMTTRLALELPPRCVADRAADQEAQCRNAGGAADVYVTFFSRGSGWNATSFTGCQYQAAEAR